MNNIEIRKVLKKANMKQWELADILGVSEFTLSRKLRKELSEQEKGKIIDLILDNKERRI